VAPRDELFSKVSTNFRDAGSHSGALWARRVFVALFTILAALAIIGIFGQRPAESVTRGPAALLKLSTPKAVRGGLFFQSRVTVRATSRIGSPRLVLDEGWVEGMQVNSIEPQPSNETSRNGRVVLAYGTLEAGEVLKVWLQFEVDPTYSGRRSYGIELQDRTARVARVSRTLRVWP
jgi:hypothetical protein